MIAGLLVSVLAFSHPVAASATPSLDEVRGKLATAGPKATVQDLAAHGRFDYVLNRIGAGDRAWVALAPKLAAGTDGGNAEGLTIALAEALPKSPRTVLAVLDLRGPVSLSPGRVCSAPFIEPKPGVVAAYKGRALRAVSAVRSAVPTGAAAACLASLKAIRDQAAQPQPAWSCCFTRSARTLMSMGLARKVTPSSPSRRSENSASA